LKLSKVGSFETKNVVEVFRSQQLTTLLAWPFSANDNIDDDDDDLSCGCSHIFSEYKYKSTFPSPCFTSGLNAGTMMDVWEGDALSRCQEGHCLDARPLTASIGETQT